MRAKIFYNKNTKMILIILIIILSIGFILGIFYKNLHNSINNSNGVDNQFVTNSRTKRQYAKGIIKYKNDQNLDLNPLSKINPVKKEIYPYLTTPYFNITNEFELQKDHGLCKLEIKQEDNQIKHINLNQKIDANWKSSKFVFTLKDNLKFYSGSPIDTNTILYSFEQLQTNSTSPYILKLIDSDKNQFEINNKSNSSLLLKDVIKWLNEKLILIPQKIYKESLYNLEGKTLSNYGTDVSYFDSYGSYYLEHQINNSSYKIKKIEGILDSLYVYDDIEIRVFNDKIDEEQAFLNKQLSVYELASPIINSKFDKYQNKDQYIVSFINEFEKDSDVLRMTALDLDYGTNDNNIIQKPKFRKALFMAINRKELFNHLKMNQDKKTVVYSEPTISYLPNNSMFLPGNKDVLLNHTPQHKENIAFWKPETYGFDKEQAKSLFEELFEENNWQKIKFTILYDNQSNVNDYKEISFFLKTNLEEIFGNDKCEIAIKENTTGLNSFEKKRTSYNNHFNICDLKYGYNNFPYLTSLKNKKLLITKLQNILPQLDESINHETLEHMTYAQLETKLKTIIQKPEIKTTQKEILLDFFSELERECYKKMDDIPLLNKPQKIIIEHK